MQFATRFTNYLRNHVRVLLLIDAFLYIMTTEQVCSRYTWYATNGCTSFMRSFVIFLYL